MRFTVSGATGFIGRPLLAAPGRGGTARLRGAEPARRRGLPAGGAQRLRWDPARGDRLPEESLRERMRWSTWRESRWHSAGPARRSRASATAG